MLKTLIKKQMLELFQTYFVNNKTGKARSKVGTISSDNRSKAKSPADYTKRAVKTALVRREFKHFTSVSTWMLNGAFGLMLLPIATGVLLLFLFWFAEL